MISRTGGFAFDMDYLVPRVNFANRLQCYPRFNEGPRFISDFQLVYVINGRGTITIGQRTYAAKRHDVFCYGPWHQHQFTADAKNPYHLIGVHFDPKADNLTPKQPLFGDNPTTHKDAQHTPFDKFLPFKLNVPDIEQLLFRIVHLYERPGYFNQLRLRTALTEACAILFEKIVTETTENHDLLSERIRWALTWLDENATTYRDLQMFYKDCGYNASYFNREFKKQTGFTVKQYQMNVRIRHACSLLRESNLTIQNIAQEAGFDSPHYFHRIFHREIGVTPGHYRNKKKGNG